ncbi:MAG: uracil-DNA glycosylase [Pirellulaceae bacterium]|nr:uracil-DNA glycosylase [Pirellulaceae bacterium]
MTDNALTTSRLATEIPAISSPATDRLATQKIGPVAAPIAAPAAEPVAELSAEPKVARVSLPLTVSTWQLPNLPESERLEKLNHLNTQVQACRKCEELVCYRRQTVFGEGKLQPRVCFFGEAPGADEDQQGRPFVGAAGKLLMDIIKAMRLSREEVYILNSLKCRPPQNRTPLPEEVDNCRPYALTQLEILQPEFIILLGAVAVQSVLQSTESVGRLRGRFHHFHGARVLVTYHPAYLLRNADAKKLVWADVQMVMRELEANPPN